MQNKKWYWPDVSDLEGAKEAARYGVWCAVFVAGVTTLFVLLAIFGFSIMGVKPNALLDAVLFAGIALASRGTPESPPLQVLRCLSSKRFTWLSPREPFLPLACWASSSRSAS